MGRKTENTGFTCINCGAAVPPIQAGTIRNHCPCCLYSMHVDEDIGDRRSLCLGLMVPQSIEPHSSKGQQIQHKCKKCGFARKNKLAPDDDVNAVVQVIKKSVFGGEDHRDNRRTN